MPATDWNWFFSSVAQSAAAIVGIFGAFIINKILGSQAAFAEKSRQLQELITLGRKLQEAASCLPFEWYHKHDSANELQRLERLLEKDDSLSPEALYNKLQFSPYIARSDALKTISSAKAYREDRLRREREEALRERKLAKALGMGGALLQEPKDDRLLWSNIPIQGSLEPRLSQTREEMDAMYNEAIHHARVTTDFLALVRPNPESSQLVTASLLLILALFFAGVVYPLSFMPVPTDWKPALSMHEFSNILFSLRGAMLLAVSLLFTAMLAMFFFLNLRLRYPVYLVSRLEEYTELSKYSPYFANRRLNDSAQPE